MAMSDETRRGLILATLTLAAVRAAVAAWWHRVTTRPPGHMSRRQRRQAADDADFWGPYQDTTGELPAYEPLPDGLWTWTALQTNRPELTDEEYEQIKAEWLLAHHGGRVTVPPPLEPLPDPVAYWAGRAHTDIGLPNPYNYVNPPAERAAAREHAAPFPLSPPAGWRDEADEASTLWTLHAGPSADPADSGILPALRPLITQTLGVPSRTRYLEAFDRILDQAHLELAWIHARYEYRAAA
jgi:hypothetical protein